MNYDVIIVGGGASGFFAAINLAQKRPDLQIAILERGTQVLEKVRISGGGRCNVTHGVFEPKPLTEFYPRGKRELLGPFHSFMTGDTLQWFEEKGVALTIEEDGRVFPVSNSSQTIIDCFVGEASRLGVKVFTKASVSTVIKSSDVWEVSTKNDLFTSKVVVMATGNSPKILQLLKKAGLELVLPVPSLFTFNITDTRIKSLAGLASEAQVFLLDNDENILPLENSAINKNGVRGPVLITHWGFSGPGILKLSSWGARTLQDVNYEFKVKINWLPDLTTEEVMVQLEECRYDRARQKMTTFSPLEIPKRLWQYLVEVSGISSDLKWAEINAGQLAILCKSLTQSIFTVNGKSTFKEEFVTAGGVDLKEIDFRTFASKKLDNFYIIGELLNIDALTGGFNFQNAWTGGFMAAQDIAQKL